MTSTAPTTAANMLFNSFAFPIFFVAVYTLFRALPLRGQNIWLLLASYFFYGCWDWRFLSLLMLSTCVDFVVGQKLASCSDQVHRKRWLLVSLSVNLGLLGIFKYLGFFAESFADLMATVGLSASPIVLNIVLPVGISFYTFQTLSYTIDIYRRELEPEKDLLTFALFVAFFPQLVAGPIERARNLLPQLRERKVIGKNDIAVGLWLVFWGYFLKLYVADNMAMVVNGAFVPATEAVSASDVTLASYAFALQIFGDFAGYSCIAIGISRLLGVRLMTNFRFPYFVTSPQAFWRHWHISLSTWLRDYLYVSLGGNRQSKVKTYRNLILTMLLGGLWHGAAWTFVIWGAYQGGLLAAHRLLQNRGWLNWLGHPLTKPIAWFCMLQLTCMGWLIFRADSLDQLIHFVTALAGPFEWSDTNTHQAKALLLYGGPMLLLQLWMWRSGHMTILLRSPLWLRTLVLTAMAWLIVSMGQFQSQEFIYFQF